MAKDRPEKDGAGDPLPLKKWRKVDDMEKLRTRVHRAQRAAEAVMYAAAEEGDKATVLKAATTLQQTARTYLKVMSAGDLEERVAALEEAQASDQGGIFPHLQHELRN